MYLCLIAGAGLALAAPQEAPGRLRDAGAPPSARAWPAQRARILDAMQEVMGALPDRRSLPALDPKTTAEQAGGGFVRRTISFTALDGGRIPAYLYLPDPAARRAPAVLALHPTSPLGKGVVDGQGDRPNRAYARELATLGYVVLAPDYPSFGDYRYDFAAGGASGTMKAIADHMRAVDLLQSLPEVDAERIGVIGHSLGGHAAMFAAAFDPRLQAVVSSCGWTPFHDYKGGDLTGWTSARYMPRIRERFGSDPDRMPFDFDEVVAALAPRPFFSASPVRDDNFAVAGVKRAVASARPVFALHGVPGNLVVEHPDCGHDFPPDVRARAYRFLDRALGRERPELVGTSAFIASPAAGVRVNAVSFYTRSEGTEMLSLHSHQTRSDTADVAFMRWSQDNGRTWSAAREVRTNEPRDGGTFRRYLRCGFVDADRDRLVLMILQGVLPGDDPLAGMRHWTLRYAVSSDGGRTFQHEAPIVHAGEGYSPAHPLPGVYTGKTAPMIGAVSCLAIRLPTGEFLQPVQITPAGKDGAYRNPGGGYTYHDAAVLIGAFDADGALQWRMSERVRGDPKRSTRGMLEPTVVAAPDGRILMVMRGSNDRRGRIPGYRWRAVSTDKGRAWSRPEPWTYDSGRRFHSPSSSSQLLRHGNGRIYWIGNITPQNPKANHPRFPLCIGEVDPESLLLIEGTVVAIDDRRAGDDAQLQLSNFFAYEDRETQEIAVHCTPIGRPHAKSAGRPGFDWTGDAVLYRVRVPR